MTVVAVEPFVVGLSVLLVVLLSSVIALRPFVVVRSSVLARPSLVSRPSIELIRTVVRSIVRPSHFAARSISSRSTADRRSLSSLELVALVDGLVSLSGNRLDSSFLFLVLLVVQVFSTLGLAVDVSSIRGDKRDVKYRMYSPGLREFQFDRDWSHDFFDDKETFPF